MKKAKIEGSQKFNEFYKSLSEDDPLKTKINEAINLLSENCTIGEKIKHDIWPKYYKKYKINNLWRYELSDEKRLIYTILESTVSIIEIFVNHTKYDKRFGY